MAIYDLITKLTRAAIVERDKAIILIDKSVYIFYYKYCTASRGDEKLAENRKVLILN